MFVAFWISLLGAMLLSVTFAALSNRKNDIEVAYWMKTDIQQNLNGTSYHRYLYAGSIIAVFDCKPHDHAYCTGLDRTIGKTTYKQYINLYLRLYSYIYKYVYVEYL